MSSGDTPARSGPGCLSVGIAVAIMIALLLVASRMGVGSLPAILVAIPAFWALFAILSLTAEVRRDAAFISGLRQTIDRLKA